MMNDESKAADPAINDNAAVREGAAVGDGAAEGIEERLARAEAEAAEYKDRTLRALAEVENVRRRGQREREDVQKFAIGNFAKDLLNVADNLRRALESVPASEIPDEAMRNLMAGVAATEREMLAAFERHGLRKIDPMGERFDHNYHQAMFELENTGQPAGTVVQVLQPGYVLHDRLLRPAMVGVAKGEPKTGERIDTLA
jgi:molecular chaperone GrpE